ncbi:MAG TPA: hypothetical protein VEF71_20065 [Streptosporangiaceae bacterium]|nr:hypothetical protein [Streptosporangiaceae bacterium]
MNRLMGAALQWMPAVSRSAWVPALSGWAGKFASDCFHPSQEGYRDWTRALLAVI